MYKHGDTSDEIRRYQRLLGVPADGIFGDWTHAALLGFQLEKNLIADGRLGPKTRAAFDDSLKVVLTPPAPAPKTHSAYVPSRIRYAQATGKYWPIRTKHPRGRHVSLRGSRSFLAPRAEGARYHMGVDLYGKNGDIVCATEKGRIVSAYHFYRGTYALFLQTDTGPAINFGELKKDSWEEFSVSVGDVVYAGQIIGRVGKMRVSSMCHFEMYEKGTIRNKRWRTSDDPPPALLDPRAYLVNLAARGV